MAEPTHFFPFSQSSGPIEHWEGLAYQLCGKKAKSLHPTVQQNIRKHTVKYARLNCPLSYCFGHGLVVEGTVH